MRVTADNHELSGTALSIVKDFSRRVNIDGYKPRFVDRFMTYMLKRVGIKKKLLGKTLEAQCESFLKEMEKIGYLKIL